jgi:hypothetical protein
MSSSTPSLAKSTGSHLSWDQPVLYALVPASVILFFGCCYNPMINIFLPFPPCMGGDEAYSAKDVRYLVLVDNIASVAVIPLATFITVFTGLALYFLLRRRKSPFFVRWSAALAGFLIGSVIYIAIPVIVNRIICKL